MKPGGEPPVDRQPTTARKAGDGPADEARGGNGVVARTPGPAAGKQGWVPARRGWVARQGAGADESTVVRTPAKPTGEQPVQAAPGPDPLPAAPLPEDRALRPAAPAGEAVGAGKVEQARPAEPAGVVVEAAAQGAPGAQEHAAEQDEPVEAAVITQVTGPMRRDVESQWGPVAGVATQADEGSEAGDFVQVDELQGAQEPVIPLLFPAVLVTSGYVVPTLHFQCIYRTAKIVHGSPTCAIRRYCGDRPSRGPVVWDVKTLSSARYVTGDLLFQREGAGEHIADPLSGWHAVVGTHWLCGEVTMRLGQPWWVEDAEGGRFCLRVVGEFEDLHGLAGLLTAAAEVLESVVRSGVEHVLHVVRPLPAIRQHLANLGVDPKAVKARYALVQAQCSAAVYPVFTTYMHDALKHPETAPDPVSLRERLEQVVGELQLTQEMAP